MTELAGRLALNPDLDPTAWSDELARTGRVPDLLAPESADAIEHALKHETPWSVTFRDGERHRYYAAQDYMALDVRERGETEAQIYGLANSDFQFFYLNYPCGWRRAREQYPDAPLNRVHDFLNSSPVIEFARALTGRAEIKGLDTQATSYHPGHFMTKHDDGFTDRIYAYTLGFSRQWKSPWGGALLFYDEGGRVIDGFEPAFNALTVFSVPCQHAVAMVTPVAQAPRLSVVGWFLDQEA